MPGTMLLCDGSSASEPIRCDCGDCVCMNKLSSIDSRRLMFAHTQCSFLVFAGKKITLVVAGTCGYVSACSLLGGCAHALLSMWVYAYFYCAIHNEPWALISFSDICVPACHCICGYTLTFPLPILSNTTLGRNIPRVIFLRPQLLGGGLPSRSWARGGETYDWRAAAPTLFVFVLAATCTMLRQDLTLSLAPTQHNTLARNHTPLPPPSIIPPPTHPHLPTHHFLQIYWP